MISLSAITQGESQVADHQAETSNAAQIEFWNSATARAWADQHARVDRAVAAITKELLELAAPRPGERILDIGCGPGTTVLELAKRVGPTGHVLGADVSEPSVARARERIAAAGLKHAEVIVADASVHPFSPDSFELTFSRFGIMFFSDPVAPTGGAGTFLLGRSSARASDIGRRPVQRGFTDAPRPGDSAGRSRRRHR